jgi:two-component sensor histidine kinase
MAGKRAWPVGEYFPQICKKNKIDPYRECSLRRRKPSIRELQKRIHLLEGDKKQLVNKLTSSLAHNYQVVSSLVALSKLHTKNEAARELLSGLYDRIHAMALILQQAPTDILKDKVDLGRFIRDLMVHLAQVYDKSDVKRNINVTEILITENRAKPLALVLNELVSNAYRYAFPSERTGTISVEMELLADDRVSITITDNGVGLPPDFDLNQSTSLGFELVRNIVVHQLSGEVKINNDQGTQVIVQFPLGS